ncbi:MAG: 30S ribosomal protein S1 [Armatimonadota bacterium]|nr:30S ribosomal protein S1 [bacterium]
MSDENVEREKSLHVHEMSETPFGSSASEAEGTETAEEQPVEEPKAMEAEEPMTMEAAMAQMGGQGVDYSGTFKSLTPGDVVDGIVVHIDREGVLVDVGTKSEGTIRPNELTRDPSLEPEQVVSVGEKIKVYVVEAESHEGGPVLSKKRADFENAWDRVDKAFADKEVIKAMVTDRVKGGLVVDLGIRGFVPASHVQSGKLKNLEKFVGQSMPFKIIEVDRERRKVVLSNRLAVEEEREELRKDTVATLAVGQIREGTVRRLTDYGAFVDLGGVDGLLHISEMSWTRINHPSEVVKVGQKIQVMVLKLNLEQGRVSLGLRQILPDPWEDIKRLYKVGDVFTGAISRLVPFGAFVQVEGGIEGIIPNSELAVKRINNPEEVVSVGQEVEVKVIDLRPDERRLTLSMRQLMTQKEKEREETEFRSYAQARPETKTTIGDLIGEQLGEFDFGTEKKEKPAKKSRAKAAKEEAIDEAEALAEAQEELAMEESIQAEIEAEKVASEEPEAVVEAEVETAAVEEAEVEAEVPEAVVEEVVEAAAEEDSKESEA